MWQRFKAWFHKWASPKWFFDMSDSWMPWLKGIAVICLVIGTVWGLAFAPQDYQQGNSFRIIYLHVPSAILAQSVFMLMAVAGFINLVWRIKLADLAVKAAAPIGAWMCFLALFTGAVWGKPAWGTWWVWDARLTSMLILLFLYFAVMALHSAFSDAITGGRAASMMAVVGVINIPIIKFSVDFWLTLHQPATFKLTEKPAMPPEMWLPLLIMVIGFYSYFGYLLFKRMRNEIIEREQRTRWVRERLVKGG